MVGLLFSLFLQVTDAYEKLLAGVHAELGKDVAYVVVEGARGDAECFLNLRGRLAGDEQPQHVGLARGEAKAIGGKVCCGFALRGRRIFKSPPRRPQTC